MRESARAATAPVGAAAQVREGSVPAGVRRQLDAVHRHIDDVGLFFGGNASAAPRASGLGRLTFEWSLLDAQLEQTARTPATRGAARVFWASPALEHVRARLRALLRAGLDYGRAPAASLGLTVQLYRLALKLSTHEAMPRRLRGIRRQATRTTKPTERRVRSGAR